MTAAAAITTGSMLFCGIEPWAPRPNSVTSQLSPAESMMPVRQPICPALSGITCWASVTSGFGKRLTIPSAIMARAP